MTQQRMRVGTKGQIVIPKPVRDEIGLQPGQEVTVTAVDGEARIRRLRAIDELIGIWKDPDNPGMADFEEEKRRERELEERKARRWD
ncbi:MAG: AbrB/MazE/SpoVT family DNA-binding domain-containing protein [Solirubrobacterales bacterium]